MKLFSLRILLPAALAVVLCASAALIWYAREREIGHYTDAQTIRRPTAQTEPRDILWQPPQALPSFINTDRDEYEPRITNDGIMLFFVRGRAGENADIYSCIRTPDGWSEPQPLDVVNTNADELGPQPSPDGRALYFYSDRSDGFGGYDLWLARRGPDGWDDPINLGAQVNSQFNEYGPALTPDTERLYFASNRPQPGDADPLDPDAWPATVREDLYNRTYDIYFSTLTERGLGPAQRVDELNSPYNDGSPAFSPAGDFLYFTSDRPGGHGGFDIYRVRLLPDRYLPPENIGPSINSAANELDPSLSDGGFALHFSSDRAPQAGGAAGDEEYDLFLSHSREVFIEIDTYRAAIDWTLILPYLIWLLLALLLLLLLLLFARLSHSRYYGKLSLLARCVLASALVHVIILILLTFWGVSSSLSGWMHKSGGTQVALIATSGESALARQVRGTLTELDIRPPAERSDRVPHSLGPLIPLVAPAVLTVEPASIRTIELVRQVLSPADAPARAARVAPPERPSPVRKPPPITIELPTEGSRASADESQRSLPSPSLSELAPQRDPHRDNPPDADPMSVMVPVVAPDLPITPAEDELPRASSVSPKVVPDPAQSPARAAQPTPPPPTLADLPSLPGTPAADAAEPTHPTTAPPAASARYDAAPTSPAPSIDAPVSRIDPTQTTINEASATSPVVEVIPTEAPAPMSVPAHHDMLAPPTPVNFDTPILPEGMQLPDTEETEPRLAPIDGPRQAERAANASTFVPDARPAGRALTVPITPPDDSHLVQANVDDSSPVRLPFDKSSQPADISLDAVPPLSITLPAAAGAENTRDTTEPKLMIEPQHAKPTDRSHSPELSSARPSSAAVHMYPGAPGAHSSEYDTQFPCEESMVDAAPRRQGPARPDDGHPPLHLPPLSTPLVPLEQADPGMATERPARSDLASSPPDTPKLDTGAPARSASDPDGCVLLDPSPLYQTPGVADSLFQAKAATAPPPPAPGLTFVQADPARPEAIALDDRLPVLPAQPPVVEETPQTPDIWGAVRGLVTHALTGEPLADVTVRLDLADVAPITVTTGPHGQYLLFAPEVPDFIALSASLENYVPETVNIAADELDHSIVTRDFRLAPKQRDVIAIEPDPDVHHLGDDRFTGRINSQFQKRSEGRRYAGFFELANDQVPRQDAYAEIHFLVRGAQRNNRIQINDNLLDTRLNRAPRDGSFGAFEASFPASWLYEGVNTIEITSVYGGSDYDDFEFVNIRIRLPLPD